MEEKSTILTESGLKKLEEQLDYLISVRRNEVSEQIAIARGFGDLSENAEYDEAKKEQAKVEAEITRLQATIRTATVVADDEITTEKVSIGTIVKVKDIEENEEVEYAIVGENTVIEPKAHVGAAPDGSEGWGVATCGPNITIRQGAVVPAAAMIYTGEEV